MPRAQSARQTQREARAPRRGEHQTTKSPEYRAAHSFLGPVLPQPLQQCCARSGIPATPEHLVGTVRMLGHRRAWHAPRPGRCPVLGQDQGRSVLDAALRACRTARRYSAVSDSEASRHQSQGGCELSALQHEQSERLVPRNQSPTCCDARHTKLLRTHKLRLAEQARHCPQRLRERTRPCQ
ncbi:unannotated protein [freshwater metagenome]|uniref:Unannotated protein n=1 Tax=freshwater metagenome TaxID=449393 RepID=A0A6J6V001_9ZZZZ